MAASGGGTVSGVVWEWQRRDSGFSPFPPQDSSIIEAAYTARSISCTVTHGRVDITKKQLQSGSRGQCAVRRSQVVLPASPPIQAYWSWDEGGGRFALYAIQATVDIEQAYLQYQSNKKKSHSTVDLSQCSSCLPYTVDFSNMTQKRHGYMTQRKITRDYLPPGLQTLLQPKASSGASSGFSLSAGPATRILNSVSVSRSVAPHSVNSTSTANSGTHTATTASTSGAPHTMFNATGGSAAGMTSATVSAGGGGGGMTSATASAGGGGSRKTTRGGRRGRRGKQSIGSSSPPLGRGGGAQGGGVPEYAVLVKELPPTDDGPCPICMCELSEQSGYDEGEGGGGEVRGVPYAPPVDLCKLRKCGHMMHRPCFLMMLQSESSKNGLTCPTCKKVYGIKTGDMPDGTMSVREMRSSLPGHEDCGTVEIVYHFSPGVHNGRHYRTNGFPRTCYLPNNEKGQKVLKLLRVAWERRLTFTIGTSVTTGATDTIVWNEIHHKTESTSNYSGHGYPDPNYLDNVLMELSLQGVTESDSDEDL